MKRLGKLLWVGGLLVLCGGAAGCITPFAMGWFTPVPVAPWVADRIEERCLYDTDYKAPVLPPIPPGHRPICEDRPDLARVLRAMRRVTRGVPYIYEEFRDDIEVQYEKIADVIDPPRFFPLIGPAQVHHCHWKCTVYYTETVESCYPFPYQLKRRRSEVVYIDMDHLHLCVPNADAQQVVTRDMLGSRP
ncbi:MAG: hypothetical protein NZO58_07075 [Gemmataceae bacterium]|nr:hypothetical protein [Gemmataceae bacterium]